MLSGESPDVSTGSTGSTKNRATRSPRLVRSVPNAPDPTGKHQPIALGPQTDAAQETMALVMNAHSQLEELFPKEEIPPELVSNMPQAPPPEPIERLPTLDGDGATVESLHRAFEWFDSLPPAGALRAAEVEHSRQALAKADITLERRECRSGVCITSMAYTPERSAELAQRTHQRDRVITREHSWSFTVFDAEGIARSHVFLNTKQIRPTLD